MYVCFSHACCHHGALLKEDNAIFLSRVESLTISVAPVHLFASMVEKATEVMTEKYWLNCCIVKQGH